MCLTRCLLHPCLSSTGKKYVIHDVIHDTWCQILVRVDGEGEADPDVDVGTRRSLPLALEGLDKPPSAAATGATEAAAGSSSSSSAVVVFYRLLAPDAAVGQLKSKWSELVEPPAAATCSDSGSDSGGGSSSGDGGTPWTRKAGIGV